MRRSMVTMVVAILQKRVSIVRAKPSLRTARCHCINKLRAVCQASVWNHCYRKKDVFVEVAANVLPDLGIRNASRSQSPEASDRRRQIVIGTLLPNAPNTVYTHLKRELGPTWPKYYYMCTESWRGSRTVKLSVGGVSLSTSCMVVVNIPLKMSCDHSMIHSLVILWPPLV